MGDNKEKENKKQKEVSLEEAENFFKAFLFYIGGCEKHRGSFVRAACSALHAV